MSTDRSTWRHCEKAEEMPLTSWRQPEEAAEIWVILDRPACYGQTTKSGSQILASQHGRFLLQLSLMMRLMFHLTKASRTSWRKLPWVYLSNTSSCWQLDTVVLKAAHHLDLSETRNWLILRISGWGLGRLVLDSVDSVCSWGIEQEVPFSHFLATERVLGQVSDL